MRTVYEFDGDLFATRAEAQAAFDARKKVRWGSAVGWSGTIRERKVFDNAQEWARYVGAIRGHNGATRIVFERPEGAA